MPLGRLTCAVCGRRRQPSRLLASLAWQHAGLARHQSVAWPAWPAWWCSLGNEFGAVHKPWESADIRFALTYPEVYEGRTRLC